MTVVVPLIAHQFDPQQPNAVDNRRILAAAKFLDVHMCDAGLAVRVPLPYPVGMLAGIPLDGGGWPADRIPLVRQEVDRAPPDCAVAVAYFALLIRRGVVGIAGKGVPVLLQLDDGSLRLGKRGGEVGQRNEVGLGGLGKGGQFRQRVVDALCRIEILGKAGSDATHQRDAPGLHPKSGLRCECVDRRQKRVRREEGRRVSVGVDGGRICDQFSTSSDRTCSSAQAPCDSTAALRRAKRTRGGAGASRAADACRS